MKISESIVQGILSGGSKAPNGSPLNRSWNHYWDRFFKTCADHLNGWLVRRFPNLNHADAEEVIGKALLKTYESLKKTFDPEKDKIEAWIFTNTRRIAFDLLRNQGRNPASFGVSFDDAFDDKDGLPLHETLGVEDAGFAAMEVTEVRSQQKDDVSKILEELEAQGKCKHDKIEVYKAIQAGEDPVDIAARFGKTCNYVHSTKNEFKDNRLPFIAQRIAEGVSLKEAVAQSTAKKKPIKNA